MVKIKFHKSLKSLVAILVLSTSAVQASENTINDNYHLSVDDKISINVFNEPDLSIKEIIIGSGGSISMPLIGLIPIKGLTAIQVEEIITEKLLDGYLKKPDVTVLITEYRPFYITGEVENPGSYAFRKGLTVQMAVTLAGGLTERASKSGIESRGEDDKSKVITVSLTDRVKPGDVITVSESFF